MWKKVQIYYWDKNQEYALWLVVPKHDYEAHPGVYGYLNEDILDEILIQTGASPYEEFLSEFEKPIRQKLEEERIQIINAYRQGPIEVYDGNEYMGENDYCLAASNILFPKSDSTVWDETPMDF